MGGKRNCRVGNPLATRQKFGFSLGLSYKPGLKAL
jgi:hypothetical protein